MSNVKVRLKENVSNKASYTESYPWWTSNWKINLAVYGKCPCHCRIRCFWNFKLDMLKSIEAISFLVGNFYKNIWANKSLCFLTSFFTESLMAIFSLIIKPRRLKIKEEILLTFGVNLCTARWFNKTNSCVADLFKTWAAGRLRTKSSRDD